MSAITFYAGIQTHLRFDRLDVVGIQPAQETFFGPRVLVLIPLSFYIRVTGDEVLEATKCTPDTDGIRQG